MAVPGSHVFFAFSVLGNNMAVKTNFRLSAVWPTAILDMILFMWLNDIAPSTECCRKGRRYFECKDKHGIFCKATFLQPEAGLKT